MKIYTYTIVHTSSKDFQDQTPYACAILEDEDGRREPCILKNYTAGMPIAIGMDVKKIPGPDGAAVYYL